MKQVAFLFLAMQLACGPSEDEIGPPPEVTRVNVEHGFCGNECSVSVSAVYSNGSNFAPSGYSLVVSAAEGVNPPAACDAGSVNGGATSANFKLKPSTAYAFRACVFSNAAGTYTPGAYVVYTTQPAS